MGTQGTPGTANPYVTNIDARLVYISVKAPPYSAVGDGTTDDRAAIQAAVDAAATTHGVVYLPPGLYAIGNALKLHKNSRLLGGHTPAWMPGAYSDRWTSIAAKAGFTDTALIQVWDNRLTSDPGAPNGGSIRGIALNGAGIAQDGVYLRGQSFDWTIQDVEVFSCTRYGFHNEGYGPAGVYGNQQESNYFHCHAWGNTSHGWYFKDKAFDHRLVACVAHTNTGDGFVLDTGCASVEFVSCRSEWNSGTGYTALSGDKVTYNGCITDRNSGDGWYVSYTICGPLAINGCYANRDIAAGVRVHNSNLVIIGNLCTRVGRLDDGTGSWGPIYGLDTTGTSYTGYSGLLEGTTAGYHDGAGGSTVKRLGGAWSFAGDPVGGFTQTYASPS